VVSIARRVVVVGEGFFEAKHLFRRSSPFLLWYASHGRRVWEFDVPLVICPLRWVFCLLGHGSFYFVPFIPPFLVLWFIYDWQGFIIFWWLWRLKNQMQWIKRQTCYNIILLKKVSSHEVTVINYLVKPQTLNQWNCSDLLIQFYVQTAI